MIDRDRPKAAQRWGASLMTRLDAAEGAGSSPRRLAACGATTHNRPLEGGHPENPGSDHLRRRALVTDILPGMSRVIVTLACVPPGKESFILHAHLVHEEFLYGH